jgi:uncharacterized protein YkwD
MPRGADVFVERLLGALVAAFLISIVCTAAVAGGGDLSASHALPYRVPSAQPKPNLELTVLNLLNLERTDRGLPTFVAHAGLRAAARAHAREMFTYGFLSHRSRDGRTPAQRVLNQQVRVGLVGENLAYAADIRIAHTELMASDQHRQNILLPQFSLVGIAVLDGGKHGVIVVQDFSAPSQETQAARTQRERN